MDAPLLCIEMNPGAEQSCVFMAHTDTVHDKGVFGETTVTRLKDRIIAIALRKKYLLKKPYNKVFPPE